MNARETAIRVFSNELNGTSLETKGDEEMSPTYIITPLGTRINRILIAGVLTEKENVGSDDEPMWKARIQDVNGSFFLNVGRYQPEAAAVMADLDTPSFIAVIGKVKTYSPEPGKTYVTIRPERICEIDEYTRNVWILESAKCMWDRLNMVKKALSNPDAGANDLVSLGFTSVEAESMIMALDHYGTPESSKYLKTIQSALRLLLPDKDVDFGIPGDLGDLPDEIEDVKPSSSSNDTGITAVEKEDLILQFIEELDVGGKGAPRDQIDRMAESEGISSTEVEEISDALMDKGLIYEPNLGFLRKI